MNKYTKLVNIFIKHRKFNIPKKYKLLINTNEIENFIEIKNKSLYNKFYLENKIAQTNHYKIEILTNINEDGTNICWLEVSHKNQKEKLRLWLYANDEDDYKVSWKAAYDEK